MSKLTFTYELVNGDGKALYTEAVAGDGIQEIMERLVKALAKYSDTTINITELHMNGKVIQDAKRLQTVTAMTTLVAEHVALSLAQSKGKRSLAENLRTILSSPKKRAKLIAELDLPSLEKGDILLVGKFKNRRAEITDFETDDKGQPVAKTTKGDQKIFKPRIAKLMPGAEPEEKKTDVNEEELYHLHAPGQKDHGKQKVLHTKDAAQMNKGAEGFKWVKHNDWLKTQLKKEAEIIDKMGKKTKQTKGQLVPRPISADD